MIIVGIQCIDCFAVLVGYCWIFLEIVGYYLFGMSLRRWEEAAGSGTGGGSRHGRLHWERAPGSDDDDDDDDDDDGGSGGKTVTQTLR